MFNAAHGGGGRREVETSTNSQGSVGKSPNNILESFAYEVMTSFGIHSVNKQN